MLLEYYGTFSLDKKGKWESDNRKQETNMIGMMRSAS